MTGNKGKEGILTRIGFWLTGLWILFVPTYISYFMGWDKFSQMKANEFGDFLAGAAAPLAFFWLVIGFLLQRKELELQRKELELQRKETERLANEAAKQATAIAANELHARKDTFCRFADLVLTEQRSLSCELYSSMLGHNINAAIDQINRGDYDFAYRQIVQSIFPDKADKMQNVLNNNFVSRDIDKFKKNFRALIQEASKCDDEDILIEWYEYGWMGNLYAGLCFLTNNRCNFQVRKEPDGPDKIF